ncbi:MAG: hypothetical protein E7653_07815 [Ruminococcaceae bacterium]|nr:hypothetical protein [Oscillospiraceae bacterium]
MGFNAEDYKRIREEYADKYKKDQLAADVRTMEIHAQLPEVLEIDRTLSHTALDIMAVIRSGNTEAGIRALEKRNGELLAKRAELLIAAGYPEDYTDVHYECDKCKDSGFGEDMTMCECMRRALALAGYQSSGLGALIGKQTFDNFEYKYYPAEMLKSTKKAVDMLKSFAETFDKDTYKNFIMTGTPGLGKTHLSTAVAQKVIDRGFDVLYVSAVSMMNDFEQKRFGSGTGLAPLNDTSRYQSCDLLIIDDLGTEVVNKFTQAYFYEVINMRMNLRKCTMINTNLTFSELQSLYSERVSSRILGEYQPLLLKGVDIRKQKSINN